MEAWEWTFIEYAFNSVRTEEGDAGGIPRLFIYHADKPYKAVFKNEKGHIIRLSVTSDPDWIKPPGIFDIEYRAGDRYSLHSFSKPEEVEKWFKERGIEDRPDFHRIYEKMCEFTTKIIGTTLECDFGISSWSKDWLKLLEQSR